MEQHKFTMARWEGDEFIIEADGKPVGGTLTERRAEAILDWLLTSGL